MIALKAPWNERNGKLSLLKLAVFMGLFIPALWIVFQYATGMLEPKPLTEALHRFGDWAVRFILLSLLVTPLRRVAQWPKLIVLRRMLGLAAFGYALAHFSLYIADQKFDLLHVGAEIALRFYLTIGFVCLLGLGALAATSTDAMIRKLGAAAWNKLHKLIYFIAALAIFHYCLQTKADVSQPVLMMGLYFILILYRQLQKRAPLPAWGVVVGAALAAPLLTALLEGVWYAIVRHIDFWMVLSANIDPDGDFRPAVYVMFAGLALIGVHFARNWAPARLGVLAAAK